MKSSGLEFGFSRCGSHGGLWSAESARFDKEFGSGTPVNPAIFHEISKAFSRLPRGIDLPFMMMFAS